MEVKKTLMNEIMSRSVAYAAPDTTVVQAARLMRDNDCGVLPVEQDDRVVGMVTDRDIAVRVIAEGMDPNSTPVGQAMTPEVLCIASKISRSTRSPRTLASRRSAACRS